MRSRPSESVSPRWLRKPEIARYNTAREPGTTGFLRFKMTDGQENHESNHVPYEEIFADINSENLPKLSKETLQSFCNVRKLKVSSEKKELVQRLEPLGKCKQLFDKKVARIQGDYKFSTALDPASIPPPSAGWKVIGKNIDVAAPIVTESTIKEYQKRRILVEKGRVQKGLPIILFEKNNVSQKLLKLVNVLALCVFQKTKPQLTFLFLKIMF